MRGQWGLISGIILVLIIAVFSVINVDPVEVNYLFGRSEWPLVLIIIGSVLLGGLIVGSVGMYKIYKLQYEIKRLKNEKNQAQPGQNKSKNDKKSKPTEKESEKPPSST